MKYWRVFCTEQSWPGLWQRCYREQVVAIGWPPGWGFKLTGRSKTRRGWSVVRNAFKVINPGDWIVVHLPKNRVGRIGEVVRMQVSDEEWNPLILPGPEEPHGEMGRRINARWDPAGPKDPDMVIQLPDKSMGGQRFTITRLKKQNYHAIRKACIDPTNWVPASAGIFAYEKSLSDYIATFPHHLEDGLVRYPYEKVREKMFKGRSRSDVLLEDPRGTPVIVECKQGPAASVDVRQLRGYMKRLRSETGKKRVRGILVHGGARKLSADVRKEIKANRKLRVEALRYSLSVDFDSSD